MLWFDSSCFFSGFESLAMSVISRYSHIEKDHLVRLLKQLMMTASSPSHGKVGRTAPNAADVPTLLGTGSFSLLDCT